MNVDLRALVTELIGKVEKSVNGENNHYNNNKVDSHEEGIFNKELAKLYRQEDLSKNDISEIMGLVKSNSAPNVAKSPQKASSKNNPDITIEHNITVDIDIDIEVSIDTKKLEELINDALEKFKAEWNAKFESEKGMLEAFIKELYLVIDQKSGDIASLKEVLDNILGEVEGLDNILIGLLNNSFRMLNILGVNSALLQEQLEKEDAQIDLLTKIYSAINAITENMTTDNQAVLDKINEVIALLSDGNTKLDDVLAMLELIQKDTSDNKEISAKILEFLKDNKTLGQEILVAIKGGNENSEAIKQLLVQFFAAFEEHAAQNDANFKALMEALKNLTISGDGTPVEFPSLENIENLLNQIVAMLGVTNDTLELQSENLGAIIANQDVMIMLLKSFANQVDDDHQDIKEALDNLIEKIGNGESSCDVDGAELMAMLQHILDAINSKEFKCDCNCGDGGDNNEDILEDLEDIFGAPAHRHTSIDNTTLANNSGPVKKYFKNGEYGLSKGTYFVDETSGRILNFAGQVVKNINE